MQDDNDYEYNKVEGFVKAFSKYTTFGIKSNIEYIK